MLNNAAVRRVTTAVLEPPARLLLRMHVSPDAVTLVGTLAAVAVAIIFIPKGWFVAAVVLLLIITFSDLMDGTMARLAGTSGPWGNFLDATLDRLADGAIFGGITLYGAFNDQPWVAAGGVFALITGQVTSYAKARAEAVGATANVGLLERAERMIVLGIAALFAAAGVPYILGASLWLIGVLGLVTIAQRIIVVRRQLKPASGTATNG